MSEAPAVSFEKVAFSYGSTPVLEDVDLSIGARESVCLIGPNGGGKTTMLRLMLGLEKPTRGTVSLLGVAPKKARTRVGYMPQSLQFDHLFPVTVLDVVLMGRLERNLIGPYRKVDRDAAMTALEKVRLTDLAARGFSRLSGGQRQRVLIARALVCEPEILLLDEPTANVDHAVEEELFEMLSVLGKGMTVVMVTHDLAVVSRLVESVVCVSDRCVHVHPTSEITGETIQALYGGNVRMILHDHRCGEEGHSHG